jgi:LCP family protein required for cell wall assembly
LWTKILTVFGALLMIVGLGAIVVLHQVLHTINNSIPQEDLLGNTVATDTTGHVNINGPINILLVGLDTRPNNKLGTRSDSIIIAHIPATHDQVYLASIPRDTQVRIPADAKTHYNGSSEKINAAFLYGSRDGGGETGGFQLLANTIKNAWHISFQAAALVNFGGFTDIINKLGTVHIYVDEKTTSIHDGYKLVNGKKVKAKPFVLNTDGTINHSIAGVKPNIYNIGYHDLDAADALDYVRQRDGLVGTDYARQRHQQEFIGAVLKELYQRGLNDPTKLSSWLGTLKNAFVFSGSGIQISDWLFALKAISPSSLIMLKTNDGTYNTVKVKQGGLTLDEEVMSATSLQMLAAIRTDTVPNFIQAHPDWVIANH